MKVRIAEHSIAAMGVVPFEVVERKGLGHPDSLADLLAEEFSQRYSRLGLDRYGVVPNHWVDKVALIGAASAVEFGSFQITKPVSAYLFGKVTANVGADPIPIEELFQAATASVLSAATRRGDMTAHVRTRVENTSGTSADHPSAFYRPESRTDCRAACQDPQANDTVFCTAHAPTSPVEQLAIEVENFANGHDFATQFPTIGSDVKVMIVRAGVDVDATVCLPFHPELTMSRSAYSATVVTACQVITGMIEDRMDRWRRRGRLTVAANTKDAGGGAYLAPFGTSLGKGDCGLVGRGNKSNGVISAFRCSGVEAVAGKNPMHHTGKLYTLAAARISDRIHRRLGLDNETVLVSRNGDPLTEPTFAGVRLADTATPGDRARITAIVTEVVSDLDMLSTRLLTVSALESFRDPAMLLRD